MRWMLFVLAMLMSVMAQAQSCGNGSIDPGEECDDGENNSDTLQNHCRGDCLLPRCGDAVVDVSETCDDGNTSDGDACSSDCKDSLQGKVRITPEVMGVEPGPELLDPGRGFELAMGLTMFGPPGLGALYGPSAGHFYAGEVGRGIVMTLLRSGVAAGFIGTEAQFINGAIEPAQFRNRTITLGLTFSTLVLIDLLDASEAVRRANEKRLHPDP